MDNPYQNFDNFIKWFYQDDVKHAPMTQAKLEINWDEYRAAVEDAKEKILTYKPWYDKLFPWKITIERKK